MKEFNINSLVRENIVKLQPYISFRDHNEFNAPVLLDANECPFGEFNRYPDSSQKKLKNKLAGLKGLSPEQIAIGNGSDELIDLIIKIFCEPKKDAILMMNPSFAMYGFYAAVNENEVVKLDLDDNFEMVKDDFIKITQKRDIKVFFLCSPNNPTGNSVKDLEFFIQNFDGIVVIDEAYIEFSENRSGIEVLDQYPNVIVLQTFSKAWGTAGARVGTAYASKEIIRFINTVKAPYNVNALSQELIISLLDDKNKLKDNVAKVLNEREWLKEEFKSIDCIEKVFPTDTNFFLIKMKDGTKVYQTMLDEEILTSQRAPAIQNCIRINVGTREENEKLINILKTVK
ncbi:histidinol-phosphate transaminase [Chryseobacterium carnipullorum]|uniref:Histidinol-phosphate aminotransferase n=1 Tax=Chryseobacterium carnipullorum TaxID=1124835 RepID=A0A376E0G4_CHRCU|nr:histidinol-phosphate transaminase [Chryseobacterium carnipullorum]AZA50252.1 histidinol-phosphate transaminase [Chryseobacterium carnipullorum]AZA65124.1 histidinol-phosphate transaminase [Chryseobacterium carnipullorum]STC98074.1 Histidinol-phosphate aminotransferase [Chryseobacterium carnipullorum]